MQYTKLCDRYTHNYWKYMKAYITQEIINNFGNLIKPECTHADNNKMALISSIINLYG